MKHITTVVFFMSFVVFPYPTLAVESLVVEGRSIPENSISITEPATTFEVVQKPTLTVDAIAPAVKATPTPPPAPPTGDPDFDLKANTSSHVIQRNETNLEFIRQTTPPPSPSGFHGSDSGVGELKAKTVPTVSNEGRDRLKEPPSDPSVGKAVTPTIGDPDFDLLNIDIGGDDLDKFRTEVSSNDGTKKVIVRGWDPDKKEEIVSHPEEVKTVEDLKIYVEAVALTDPSISDISITKSVVKVKSVEKGKLFWVIPVEMSSVITLNFSLEDTTRDPVDVKLSWWHVFVKKPYSADALKEELSGVFDPSKWQKVDNSEVPTDVSRISHTLQLVSGIMKTKHDTVKNSIGNVR